MSKALISVTQSWQEAAIGAAIFTVEEEGSGVLYFNETEDDSTAYKIIGKSGEQFEQTAAVSTNVRATGDGWKIIADGGL